MQDAFKAAWNNRALGYVLLGVTALSAMYMLWKVPSPGVAVAVLGVASGIIAIRELSAIERVVWVFVLSCLLYAELHAIRTDRNTQDQKHAAEVKVQTSEFEEQQKQFKTILDTENAEFKDTKDRISRALDAAEETLIQTAPRADLQIGPILIYPKDPTPEQTASDPKSLSLRRTFTITIDWANRGTDEARRLKILSNAYLVPELEGLSPVSAKDSFNRDWQNFFRAEKKPDRASQIATTGVYYDRMVSGDPHTEQYTRPWGPNDIYNDLIDARSKAVIHRRMFILVRFDYYDKTGHWREDICRRIKGEMTSQSSHWDSCDIMQNARYRIGAPLGVREAKKLGKHEVGQQPGFP
ncbi:hypothetical protein [Terriglobus saanensis]|uniref:Uncharacterized protein n=1 Tax=Terriglobus saanensis (strain ATCC BAA-1853 / DSM 23119 / SP1PR4) TaxID=401053 RepID=E8V2L1_TERSS|nr:hypothetical protein [Terriglobus saanensis]ADV82429.1 hypothetical protein AciPR4_1614 [Terriglobus saanensis SP1PR4]